MATTTKANATGAGRRKPTYGAATRLARIVHGLVNRPFGWSFDAIALELGIVERTLQRYIEACREELVDAAGEPILEVERHGDRRVLRLASRVQPPEAGTWTTVSFLFTWSMIRFLQGTVLEQGMDVLWDKLLKTLAPAQRQRLQDVERKFYAVSITPKDYRAHDGTIATLIPALVDQHRLRIDYGGLLGDGRVHEVEPYTLLGYRGGLYLLGKSNLANKVLWFAVERIRSATVLRGPDGKALYFVYPKSFRPERYVEGMFGVVEGPEAEVELLILNEETAAYLRQRTVHPTQRFRAESGGRTRMTMKVRGTAELANWILSLTPWVEVLRPRELREEIRGRLAEGLSRHRRTVPAPAPARHAKARPR